MARVNTHTSAVCLDVETNPNVPRTERKAVPKGIGSFPHYDYESGGLTMKKVFQMTAVELGKNFDRWASHFYQRLEDKREEQKKHRLAGLQHQAQQPRLTTEARKSRQGDSHVYGERCSR